MQTTEPEGQTKEEQLERDRQQLHRLGYAQQLFRDMGGFSNFALSFSVVSILTGAVVLYGTGLNGAGPFQMTVGWPLITVLTLPVAMALAELASAYPTAGALYHWASILGGRGWGWYTAWLNMVGQFAITAGIDYGLARFLCDLLGLGAGAHIPVFAVVLATHAVLNHLGVRAVTLLNWLSAWYHIVAVIVLVALVAAVAPMQEPSFLLTRATTNERGLFYGFVVGLLQAQWTYTGYDASAHITEETLDPSRNAPWGIFLSVAVSGVFGYALLLAVTLAIGDLPAAMAAPNPFIFVLQSALGGLGTALVWVAVLAMWFCGLSSMTSNSRMIFAFARDGGMPLSKLWASVGHRRTPHPAIYLSAVVAFLLAVLCGLVSAAALDTIGAMSTIAIYLSYGAPILLAILASRRGKFERGPWHLGRWSQVVRVAAVAWIAVITVIFVLPPNQASGYFFVALMVVLTAFYLLSVRKWFKGPRVMGTEEDMMRLEKEAAA